MSIEEAIDVIFSHNELVRIWNKRDRYDSLEWSGMAHEIPMCYKDLTDWKIKGIIAESIYESDYINIVVEYQKEITDEESNKIWSF